jgi:hypothetical protein
LSPFRSPVRPGDVPHDVPVRALLNVQLQHAEQVRTYAANRDEHAVAALALMHAIVEVLLGTRWGLVEAALQSGCSMTEVADACGLDVEELRVGYSHALDERVLASAVTPAERDVLVQLIEQRR